MTQISEYIYCAFLASLAAGLSEHINLSKAHAKVLRFVMSLTLLFFLVAPLKPFVAELGQWTLPNPPASDEENEPASYEALNAYMSREVAKAVSQAIAEDLGIADVRVSVTFSQEDASTFLLARLDVILPAGQSGNADRVKRYLENEYRCTVFCQ